MAVNPNGAVIFRVKDGDRKIGGLLALPSGEYKALDVRELCELSV